MAVLVGAIVNCQPSATSRLMEGRAIVDDGGALRWADSETEIALFGVNYTATFALGFRALGYVGAPRDETIDHDLAHLTRLGVDGVRLCLWGDWELTDRDGNLLDNEHLRLTDYFIAKAGERGMHILLTPIVTYSAQWPEPEEDGVSQGFAKDYSRSELGTDPNARKAQANYLGQLMEHVNRYTDRAYKDDPTIVAVELINEPVNPPSGAETREYIEALAAAVRATGCRKPLLYNVSQSMWDDYVAAVRDSPVEGGTLGWYPTGLLAGHSLRGDFLPKVDQYAAMHHPWLAQKATLVYEFDAADIPGSHMYPAMARTFRSGGAQWATMFSYDPLPLAATNAEYQTHYLNLIHTPGKAISLMIAGEAFRRLPRGKSYGSYPENTRFGPFRISYEEDLSEMVTDTELMHSNSTRSEPPHPELLERVVGCGSTPVVEYEGTGTYFLEKLEAGVWRLEVYPDALWVRDPYRRPCLDREVSRVLWRQWPMAIRLPDLGERFTVAAVNEGNSYQTETADCTFPIRPGVYLVVREGMKAGRWQAETPFGRLKLGEFVAPPEEQRPTVVVHEPPREVVEGEPFTVSATVVSSQLPERVSLYVRRSGEGRFRRLEMQREHGYRWAADIPAEQMSTGELEYCISVAAGEELRTYPANVAGEPADVGFCLPEPDLLYAPHRADAPPAAQSWGPDSVRAEASIAAGSQPDRAALQITASGLGDDSGVAVVLPLEDPAATSRDWRSDTAITVRARSGKEGAWLRMELAERSGVVYALGLPLTEDWHDWPVPLRDFVPVKGSQMKRQVDLAHVESLRLAVLPARPATTKDASDGYHVQVESVLVHPVTSLWRTRVVSATEPIVIFDAESDGADLERRATWGYQERLVPGSGQDRLSLRIGTEGFGRWLREVSCRHWFGDRVLRRGEQGAVFDTVRLVIRAGEEATNAVQFALTDKSGASWGAVIPLTLDWQEVRLELGALRPVDPPQVPRPWPLPTGVRERREAGRALLVRELDALQISFGPSLFPDQEGEPAAVELEMVALETPHLEEAADSGQDER